MQFGSVFFRKRAFGNDPIQRLLAARFFVYIDGTTIYEILEPAPDKHSGLHINHRIYGKLDGPIQFRTAVANVHMIILPFEEKQRLVFHLLDFQLFLFQFMLLLLKFVLFAEHDRSNYGRKHGANTKNDIPYIAPCRKSHIEESAHSAIILMFFIVLPRFIVPDILENCDKDD